MKKEGLSFFLAILVSLIASCNFPLSTPAKPTLRPTQQSLESVKPSPSPQNASGQNSTVQRVKDPQIGLNFIRFYWSEKGEGPDTTTSLVQPETIFNDFRYLGVHTYRQFVKADLFWDVIEPRDDQWNFAQADVVLANNEFEPIVTLFRMQYASPTPPWAKSPQEFQITLGVEATDYLTTVVKRYADQVRYWEIGNEMVFWRAADPESINKKQAGEKLPASSPPGGYSPREQGVFLAQAAAIIRRNDPDAVILMPGLPGLDDYGLKTWLPDVLETGGKDWFDIVNYHYYGDWEPFTIQRPRFSEALQKLGLDDKPIWCTETGATANPSLTLRTNYPNNPEQQAADIFRRIVSAWGLGDTMVMWHTYLTNSDTQGDWSAYGILTEEGNRLPSYYAFHLLTSELVPFVEVEKISADGRGLNVYRVKKSSGGTRFVAWGKGDFKIPEGVTQMTPVVTLTGGYTWQAVQGGQTVPLSPIPVLFK